MNKIFSVVLLCAALVLASCSTNEDTISVSGVTLNETTLTLTVGDEVALVATIDPEDADEQGIIWASSDATVATVSPMGEVTAVKAGTATITATSVADETLKAACAVTVSKAIVPVASVTLNKTTLSLVEAGKELLVATIAPADATSKSVVWSSSDEAVATVSPAGEVTAVKAGTATITAASFADNTKKAACAVTVTKKEKTLTWAKGNLIADGANGAKTGTATDKGLFFQFGSLIGWSEAGNPAITVKPAAFNGKEGWADTGKIWQGTTGTVPFTAIGSDDEKAGIGDPCRYYLKGTWRLPTKDEYVALFKDGGYPNGAWKWENASATNSTLNLTFAASGYRYGSDGSLSSVGTTGYYWSASPVNASAGYGLYVYSSYVDPNGNSNRAGGLPVRCVQESN